MHPQIVDDKNILDENEKKELLRYLIEKCRTTVKDIEWLERIIIRSDDRSGYLGYWSAQVRREHGHILDFHAIIVLNSWYLATLDAMKRTLAHEYGHHWTLAHLIYLDCFDAIDDIFNDRLPWVYYRMRRLSTDMVTPDAHKWDRCDKEVMAEDYRLLFTPNKEPHTMEDKYGNPSTEVVDYLASLCYRRPR